ncbi:MAG: sugar kinase [Nitrosopumilus sp. H13]|nr:MAG: sugar kinase [Nitrosopumilus sp. H13]
MLAVFGSASLDTIRTPKKTVRNVLGGAAIFASIAASNFVETGLIAVTGRDFPKKYLDMLSKKVDLRGLTVKDGRTFRYDGRYSRTLDSRSTVKVELNVLADFKPAVPDDYRRAEFVYLANNDPDQNIRLLKEFDRIKFSMCDTIDFWISTKRQSVIKMIKSVDAVVINDEEARLLTKEFNLIKCAKKIMGWGARFVVIKKAEHGSLLFYDDMIFPSPGFSLEDVVDPTGAGDSFAGAMIGYMASKRSTSMPVIKKAVAYGNILGSFAVEGYGLDRLFDVRRRDIAGRLRTYEKMIRF